MGGGGGSGGRSWGERGGGVNLISIVEILVLKQLPKFLWGKGGG